MDGDGSIGVSDVSYLRSVLLGARPLPFAIGADGGVVVGNGGRTTFVVPAGLYSHPTRLAVEDYPRDAMVRDLGSEPSSWGNDAMFMAGAQLVPLVKSPEDSLLLSNVGMVEALPPGASVDSLSGSNGAFTTVVGADGNPALVPLKPLTLQDAGHGVVGLGFAPHSPIHIDSIDRVYVDFATLRDSVVIGVPIEPGMEVGVYGTGWPTLDGPRYELRWSGPETTTTVPVLTAADDRSSVRSMRGLVGIVPRLTAGQYAIRIYDRRRQTLSNALTLDVANLSTSIEPGQRDSLVSFMDREDAAFGDLGGNPILQDQFTGVQTALVASRADLKAERDSLAAVPESLLDLDAIAKRLRYLTNARFGELLAGVPLRPLGVAGEPSCEDKCEKEKHDRIELCVILLDPRAIAAWAIAVQLTYLDCVKCCRDQGTNLDIPVCAPPEAMLPADQACKIICLHYKCGKLTVSTSPMPGPRARLLRGIGEGPLAALPNLTTPSLDGVIVSVRGSTVPSAGVMGPDGIGLIPFNNLGGDIALVAYDPRTGLVDVNAGHASIGLAESHVIGLTFAPDDSKIRLPLPIGETKSGTVRQGSANYEFAVFVSPARVGIPLACGLSASAALTLRLQAPDSAFVFRDSSTSCALLKGFVPKMPGTYTLTVGSGVAGTGGAFTVGVSEAPAPPTPFLCGSLEDTLYARYSPYRSAAVSRVEPGRVVVIEGGASIEFDSGGAIVGEGTLQGVGVPARPIVLRPGPSGIADWIHFSERLSTTGARPSGVLGEDRRH
jgi:hypothetical protein